MSTIVLLSSSPPRVFARSPTPVESSSPLPSTTVLLQGQSPARKRFKTTSAPRDGYVSGFTTARKVLAEKPGAENAIMKSLGRNKFRSSQGETVLEKEQSFERTLESNGRDPEDSLSAGQDLNSVSSVAVCAKNNLTGSTLASEGCDSAKGESTDLSSLQRATTRRLDWTPPKLQKASEEERSVEYSAGYLNGMISGFAYPDAPRESTLPHVIDTVNPAKRRRVDSSGAKQSTTDTAIIPKLIKVSSVKSKAAPKRTRSPAKKALTITGLATSNHLGDQEPRETPMMQYLTSTQAQLQNTSAGSGLGTKIQKTKAAAQKLKDARKNKTKSLLLSPTSAMKTYDDQEAIFGSASQLARDDSPKLLKETIEAIKLSESMQWSDPLSSPVRTQLFSAENTPQIGTGRYRRTRNLWAAAGRDEDNALLQVETIDLTDTPAIRTAFAGKDVLLQNRVISKGSTSKPSISLRGGYSPLSSNKDEPVFDIADIETPCVNQKRALSTTVTVTSPRKSPSKKSAPIQPIENPFEAAEAVTKEPQPPKPNYSGWTTQQLNKQIVAYGFKAMRKREKMIDLLDRCWVEKHGPAEKAVEVPQPDPEPDPDPEPAIVAPFGDFLSKVHDISARPEPKIKKPRVRKKKDQTEQDGKEKAVKKPRQRKKKETEPNAEADGKKTPKKAAPRKRRFKATGVDTSLVTDIDDILMTVPEELRSLEAFDDWAKPERNVGNKKLKPNIDEEVESNRLPTPPPTIPPAGDLPPSEPTKPPSKSKKSPKKSAATPRKGKSPTKSTTSDALETSPSFDLSQIYAAIKHQSQQTHLGRNHNTHPTWHEKILLYDPIILEDLATWLNTEGLGAIGEDQEVSALEVRAWCESNGICCLWKGGWRGNKLAKE